MNEKVREDELFNRMILLALAHDFMSPFRALVATLEDAQEWLENRDAPARSEMDRLRSLSRNVEAQLLPTLASLYNDVKSKKGRSSEELLSFLRARVGSEIDSVVLEARSIQPIFDQFNDQPHWNSMGRDFAVVLSKVANMLGTLDLLKQQYGPNVDPGMANLNDAAVKAKDLVLRKGIPLAWNIDGQATIMANSGQIWSVFSNLINNAVKYSFSSRPPKIDIYISRVRRGDILKTAQTIVDRARRDQAPDAVSYQPFTSSVIKHRDWIEVLVRDEGIGIPHQRVWGLFKPYKQLDADDYANKELFRRSLIASQRNLTESHYGFGLALCQFFVRLHEGEMVVNSREGGPTTVAFWLPVGPDGNVRRSSTRRFSDLWWVSERPQYLK